MHGKLLFTVSLCALAAPAFAQPVQSGSKTSTQATSPTSGAIGDIVVTAQRREERLHDVPITVNTASSQQLDRAGVATVRDLGRVVSGFTLSGQGFQSQPAIRGVSTFVSDGTGSSPNALYIDGVYQPLFTALSAEISDIDRIEVLKGPQGTLFGRNATGGAVQLFTRRPSFDPHEDVKLTLGEFTGDGGSRSSIDSIASAFVTGPIVKDTVAVSLAGSYRYAPGYLVNDATGKRDGEIKKAYLHGKLLIEPSSNVELLGEGHYIDLDNYGEGAQAAYEGLSAASVYPGSVVPTDPWHVAYNLPNFIHYHQYGGSLTAKVKLDAGTISSVTAYDQGRVHVFNSVHGAQGTLGCLIAFACLDTNFDSTTKTFEQEVNFASRNFGPISFTAGLFYLDLKATTGFFIQPQLIPPHGLAAIDLLLRTKSYAAYGEVTWRLTDRLSLIGGLRYGKDDDRDRPLPALPDIKRNYDAFTPRASLKYDITDQLNVYATYSQGYKAGLSGASNAGSVPPFQAVSPERINAYEIGTKYSSHDLSLNLSGWYYDYKNKQESVFSGTTPIIQNTGPVRLYGVDADASLRLSREFTVQANGTFIPVAKFRDYPDAAGYSLIQGPTGAFLPGIGLFAVSCPAGARPGCVATGSTSFDATGFRIPRAPKFSGNLTLAWEHETGAGKWDASTTLSYSSKLYHTVNHTVVQPGYATVAAQADYHFGSSGLTFGVFGQNLTNHVIIQGSISSTAGNLQTLAAPRELGVKMDYAF
jgi:iron complex outermembrane recepter protein